MKRKPKNRNPIAKAVRRIRPKVVPDNRRKLLTKADKINHQVIQNPSEREAQ